MKPHTDWQAEWIWHPPLPNMDDLHVYARKTFALEAAPDDARCRVTASALYKLFVNGHYVGRGPNPADPSFYYYDVYDLTPYLQPGRNCIAAHCYCYGERNRGVIRQNWGPGGFLLELTTGGDLTVKTDATWRVLQAPEWAQDVQVNNRFTGDFKEFVDTRREPVGWRKPEFDDADWAEPHLLGRPPVEPWTSLNEREIPFLGGERAQPRMAYFESAAVNYPWSPDLEVEGEARLVPGLAHRDADKPCTVRRTHDDFAPALILDFGRLVTGYPEIVIDDSEGGVIDVLYGECLYLTRTDSFTLRGGPQVLRPYNRRTCQYIKLLFRETPAPVAVREVAVQMDTYPVEYRGAFRCNDEFLNHLWDVGRRSIHLSMLDHFVDCPRRERTTYGGDIFVENLAAWYCFGDARLNHKTVRQLAAIQYDSGAIPPWGPYRGSHFYPSWGALWALDILDDYTLTGDRGFLDEIWPALRRFLDWAVATLDDEGLIPGRGPLPDGDEDPAAHDAYARWAAAEKRPGYSAHENAPFAVLFRRVAKLAAGLGRTDEASRYADAARRMHEGMRRHCLPPDDGRTPRQRAEEVLWAGVMTPEEAAPVIRAGAEHLIDHSGPYSAFFLTEGMYAYGEPQVALDYMRSYWGDILNRGASTVWEHWNEGMPPGAQMRRNDSRCHGWGAGPNYLLLARVCGIRPTEPGFARMVIEPEPADLQWAEGTLPTPHGDVHVHWRRADGAFEIDVTVPAGCTADLRLPPEAAGPVTAAGRPVPVQTEDGRQVVELEAGTHTVRARL